MLGGSPEELLAGRRRLLAAVPDVVIATTHAGAPSAAIAAIDGGVFWGGARVDATMAVLSAGTADGVEACLSTTLSSAIVRRTATMLTWDLPLAAARGLGLSPVVETCRHRVALAQVRSPPTATASVRSRAWALGDHDAVVELQRTVAQRHDGGQARDALAWRLLDATWGQDVERVVLERNGRLCGFAILRNIWLAPHVRDVELVDVALVDQSAARGLVSYLRHARPETRCVIWYGARFDRLLQALAELGAAPAETSMAPCWARVVDVVAALTQRGYVRGRAGVVDLHIDDPINPRNRGLFRLEVRDGRGSVTVGGLGDVRLSVDVLTQLFAGRRSALELRRAGRIEGREDGIRQADQLFAGSTPWISERYATPWPTQPTT